VALGAGCGLVAACRGAVGGAFGVEAQPPTRSATLSQRAAQAHRRRGSVVRARADIGCQSLSRGGVRSSGKRPDRRGRGCTASGLSNPLETRTGISSDGDRLQKHRLGTDPECGRVAVEGLVKHEGFQGFAVPRDAEHTVLVSLVMAVTAGSGLDRQRWEGRVHGTPSPVGLPGGRKSGMGRCCGPSGLPMFDRGATRRARRAVRPRGCRRVRPRVRVRPRARPSCRARGRLRGRCSRRPPGCGLPCAAPSSGRGTRRRSPHA